MEFTILKRTGKVTLAEFRNCISVLPGASIAGEFMVTDELTGLAVLCSGDNQIFLIGENSQLAELSLDVNYGYIDVNNLSLDSCKKICKLLKAGIRPVTCHGSNAPLPEFIFDYSGDECI